METGWLQPCSPSVRVRTDNVILRCGGGSFILPVGFQRAESAAAGSCLFVLSFRFVLFASYLLHNLENVSFFLAHFKIIWSSRQLWRPDRVTEHPHLHRPGSAHMPQWQCHSPEGLQGPPACACACACACARACACACVPDSRIWLTRGASASNDHHRPALQPEEAAGSRSSGGQKAKLKATSPPKCSKELKLGFDGWI